MLIYDVWRIEMLKMESLLAVLGQRRKTLPITVYAKYLTKQ